jgi:hypothetical protein
MTLLQCPWCDANLVCTGVCVQDDDRGVNVVCISGCQRRSLWNLDHLGAILIRPFRAPMRPRRALLAAYCGECPWHVSETEIAEFFGDAAGRVRIEAYLAEHASRHRVTTFRDVIPSDRQTRSADGAASPRSFTSS